MIISKKCERRIEIQKPSPADAAFRRHLPGSAVDVEMCLKLRRIYEVRRVIRSYSTEKPSKKAPLEVPKRTVPIDTCVLFMRVVEENDPFSVSILASVQSTYYLGM